MSDNQDLATATEAWLVAKNALSASDTELAAAKAGHEVATRCEREAWERIAKICGREPAPPAPPQAPVHRVYDGPFPSSLVTGEAPDMSTYRTGPLSYRLGSGPMIYSGSNGYNSATWSAR